MRMRWLGQVQIIGLVAALAAFATPSHASDCNQCEAQSPASAAAQPEEAAPAETEQAAKPLPLVNRKASKPRKEKTARKEKPAEVAQKPVEKSAVDKSVKNARAQATDTLSAEDRDASVPDGNVTDADRFPTPESPVVSADEVNEIDAAAPHEAQAAAPAPAEAPRASVAAEPQPRLSLARIEAPENATVAQSRDGAWEQSSLIGKIFIAMGGLLAAASAVRMFVG